MRDFVREYFDGKPLDKLKRAITPDWSEKNLNRHLNLLAVPDGAGRILEVGCGMARLLIPIYDQGKRYCVGVDASPQMIGAGMTRIGSRNIKLILCDGTGKIPLREYNFFDFAFSIITFQHIPNIDAVKRYLGEMHRLLNIGGLIRFQILARDVKPGRELWTYHEPIDLLNFMEVLGFEEISLKEEGVWAIISGKKAGHA